MGLKEGDREGYEEKSHGWARKGIVPYQRPRKKNTRKPERGVWMKRLPPTPNRRTRS